MVEHHNAEIRREDITIPKDHRLGKIPLPLLVLGVLLLLASFGLGLSEPRQFWYSYLVASFYTLTLGLGGLFFVLLQFATRAGWSVSVRRVAEHLMGFLPVGAVLALPLLAGAGELFEWLHPEAVAEDHLLQHKSPYLNAGFFYLRFFVCLLAWSAMALWFRRQSILQDETGDPEVTRRLQRVSAPCLLIYGITVTFFSFDLIMSLEPHWYSTIFGVYIFAGSAIGVLSFLAVLIFFLQRQGLLQEAVTAEHLHDIGKLLFGFVVFWTYIGFSQFMLIWYGNLPEETVWYLHRTSEGWIGFTWFLVFGHFIIPFFYLIFRGIKRRPAALAAGGAWLLIMHYLDLYWLAMPVLHREAFQFHLLDLLTFLGHLAVLTGTVLWLLRGPVLVPVKDPRLDESLTLENL